MTKIKVILIDDEEKALESLHLKISRFFKEIEIIASCNNPKEAIHLINKLKPDLVFLDIEMPVWSGFDVLAKIDQPIFEVIFVTAYSNYAIEAIQNCAIGYVVKPIDNEELIHAISNAIQNINQKTALEKNVQLLANLGHKNTTSIAIPSQKGLQFIKSEKIIRLEGIDGYTKIYSTDNKPLLSSYSIGKFSKLLTDSNFFLCHKSHLINLQYVQSILKEGSIELSDNNTVPLAKAKKKELIIRMGNL